MDKAPFVSFSHHFTNLLRAAEDFCQILVDRHFGVFVVFMPVRLARRCEFEGERAGKAAARKAVGDALPVRDAVKGQEVEVIRPENMRRIRNAEVVV